MAERTVTLEFSLNTGAGFRSGFTPYEPGPAPFGFAVIHAKSSVAEHLDPLPLCWVAEGQQKGATVEEWEVSFDHETLPNFAVIDVEAFVTCTDCKEWLHA